MGSYASILHSKSKHFRLVTTLSAVNRMSRGGGLTAAALVSLLTSSTAASAAAESVRINGEKI